MEKLMKEMKSLDEKREIEIQSFKKKCENQETVISSIKKSIQMDKLEKDFETYKKDMEMRIKSLENSKSQLQSEKSALQRKYDVAAKSLTTETSLRLSSSAAQRELQKKMDELKKQLEAEKTLRKTDVEKEQKKNEDLTKQLDAEKALRKAVEDKVFSLESQIALNKVIPTPLTPVTPKPPSLPDMGDVSDVKPSTVDGFENAPLLPAADQKLRRGMRKRKSMGTGD